MWHSPAVQTGKEESNPNTGATAQGVGSKNKKKNAGDNQSLARAPTVAAATAAASRGWGGQKGDKRPRQLCNSDEGGTKLPVHNFTRHTASKCREIKKLAEQFREKITNNSAKMVRPSASGREAEGARLEFQDARRPLKAAYGNSDSESSDNECRKVLHIIFGGSWNITSWRVVKTLRREIASTVPAPRATPHRRWMETPIGFNASDYPKSMAGARQLPLLVSLTIANIKLYHVLINGGAALNLISLTAFRKLQIPIGKLQPSRPFSGVGPVSVMLSVCISLPVTFRTAENFHTESILFDVAEVSLLFSIILGRPALY
jgi:hypothetical protein